MDNEFVRIRDELDKKTQKTIKKLLKKYKNNQDEIIKIVAAIIVENTDDSGTIFLSESGLEQLRNGISTNLNEMKNVEIEFINELLDDAYKEAHKNTAIALGMGANWNILRDEFVDAAINKSINGKNYSHRIWSNTDELANRIYDDVLECVRTGKRPNQIIREIKNDYGVTAYQAKRLVNTELARVVNDAQMEVYRNSGIVQKVMWTATLESNTCEKCAELDGKIFELREAPSLPMHPCCRCCLIPIVEDWKAKERSDNETKKNINYVTFEEWNSSK